MEQNDQYDGWDDLRAKAMSKPRESHNFVCMTKIPKNVTGKSMTSMIASTSKVIPVEVKKCIVEDSYGRQDAVVIQFRNEKEAFRAVERLKATPYAKSWQMNFLSDPDLKGDPDADMLKRAMEQ